MVQKENPFVKSTRAAGPMGMVVGGFTSVGTARTARWETTSFGGSCPVQAEGWIEIDGRPRRPFYFQATESHWAFDVYISKQAFNISAGWDSAIMNHATAHAIVDNCIQLFVCADIASLDQPEPEIKT